MKRIITIFILFYAISFSYAQHDKKERIQALKVAFITNKLELSSGEAEKFWPIYNKYEAKIMQLRIQKMKAKKDSRNGSPSKEELIRQLESDENLEIEIIQLRKKMKEELIPIIGVDKVVKLQNLEIEFKKKLLEKLKERHPAPSRARD